MTLKILKETIFAFELPLNEGPGHSNSNSLKTYLVEYINSKITTTIKKPRPKTLGLTMDPQQANWGQLYNATI